MHLHNASSQVKERCIDADSPLRPGGLRWHLMWWHFHSQTEKVAGGNLQAMFRSCVCFFLAYTSPLFTSLQLLPLLQMPPSLSICPLFWNGSYTRSLVIKTVLSTWIALSVGQCQLQASDRKEKLSVATLNKCAVWNNYITLSVICNSNPLYLFL